MARCRKHIALYLPSAIFGTKMKQKSTIIILFLLSLNALANDFLYDSESKKHAVYTYEEIGVSDQPLCKQQKCKAVIAIKNAAQLKNKTVSVQKLLNPEIIELNPKQFITATSNLEFLKNLGYEIEEFGQQSIIVRTIPVLLGRQFDKQTFMDYLSELEINKNPESLEKFFHDKIARMSCRTAIKAGDEITLPQIKDYIQKLNDLSVPYTCPHGRPIMIRWSHYELEKMFKRIV